MDNREKMSNLQRKINRIDVEMARATHWCMNDHALIDIRMRRNRIVQEIINLKMRLDFQK